MQRSFQPVMTTIVLTAAMLLACVPASADVLTLEDGATHNLDYAVAQDDVHVRNSTTANLLTGGSIGQRLTASDTSTVNVSGGEIGWDLRAWGDSEVNVSGGSIGVDLKAWDNSTVTIFGTFDIFGYGVYGDGDLLDGATLTGILADGTAFNNDVFIFTSATVTLAAPVGGGAVVPEPSSMAMFGIGALGLFGYSRRRRQTSAAA